MAPNLRIDSIPALGQYRITRPSGESWMVGSVKAVQRAIIREARRTVRLDPQARFVVKDSDGRTLTYEARGQFRYET
jgi:hypothetical protein